MKRFIEGEARSQSTLFPEVLDDYIAENNPVRVIDVFVDELDLGQLGSEGVELRPLAGLLSFNAAETVSTVIQTSCELVARLQSIHSGP